MPLSLRRRRAVSLAFTALAAVLWLVLVATVRQRLGHAGMVSGMALAACLGALALLAVRRRLAMLPLGPMSRWVQVHIYTGLFALVAYLLHVPRVVANGWFEGGLSLLFLAVSGSGLYGLYISRVAPRRLTAVPGEFRWEQIGWHRRRIAEQADRLVEQLPAEVAGPVLADHFRDALQPYFLSQPPLGYLIVPNGVRRRRLLGELSQLDRYLSDEVRAAAGRLAGLVRSRDELDYHQALQLRLRLWLAIHAALTGGLLVWATLHVLMVLHFLGH